MLDADIRHALHAEIRQQDPGATIINELGLCRGQVRADVVVVGDMLSGYEIKSPADTLARLPEQVRVYSQIFDACSIVLAKCHLAEAFRLIPNWWSLILATARPGSVHLELMHRGVANPGIDIRALAELLWHDDAMALLRRKDEHRGLSGKPRRAAWDRVAQVCTVDEVRSEVRARLKVRAELRLAVRAGC